MIEIYMLYMQVVYIGCCTLFTVHVVHIGCCTRFTVHVVQIGCGTFFTVHEYVNSGAIIIFDLYGGSNDCALNAERSRYIVTFYTGNIEINETNPNPSIDFIWCVCV